MNDGGETGAPVLEATGVSKRFGPVTALRDARLTVRRGEIVALMGANGAGKSTFVKILTGALRRDGGEVRIHGAPRVFAAPAAARAAGIVSVYQEPALIPDLTVADNLRLGDTPEAPFLHWVGELGIAGLRLDATAGRLPLATLRILDLARALASEPEVLMLDEMTAALPTDLVERVLKVVRAQADAGRAVVYISHRFAEIAELCDRATVLRDGATVGDVAIEPGVEDRVVEMMLGAALTRAAVSAAAPGRGTGSAGPPRLRLDHVGSGPKLEDVSFELHEGEVLGVVALEGQGQDELFDVLAGFRRPTGGSIEVEGRRVAFRHPADAIAAGLTLVPGNRADALLAERSVRENIALPLTAKPRHWGLIPMRREARARVRGDRAAADRHPGPGRGASPVRRQPAEGDDRALGGDGRTDAPALRPHPRHRRAYQGADLPAGARARRPGCGGALLHLRARRGAARVRPGGRHLQGAAGGDRRPCGGERGTADARGLRADRRRGRGMIQVLTRSGWVLGLVGLLVLLAVVTRLIQPGFGASGFESLGRAALPFAFATAGMTVVVLVGGIDLSVASMMAVASVTAAVLMDGRGRRRHRARRALRPRPRPGHGRDQRRADRRDAGARHRGDAGDAVRLGRRRAADPAVAGRRGDALAARPDRRERRALGAERR